MTSQKIQDVKAAYDAVEHNDIAAYLNYFTADAIYKVGNFDAVHGHEGIRALAEPLVEMFTSVTHDVKQIWEIDDTVVVEMDVIYLRKDGKETRLPCVDIIDFVDGKVKELKAYLDPSPAFS
jgi:ketosteroid isomerase-like protein